MMQLEKKSQEEFAMKNKNSNARETSITQGRFLQETNNI